MHDTIESPAMNEAKGVSQFMNSLFDQPLFEQRPVLREAVESFVKVKR